MVTYVTRRLLCLTLIFALFGCSDTNAPPSSDGDLGALDPTAGRVTLKQLLVVPPDGPPVPLILESGSIELLDDGSTVIMSVSLRNAGDVAIHGPLVVWIGDLDPDHVLVTNADMVTPTLPGEPPYYGFEYTGSMGEDEILEPGETSDERFWHFHDVGFGSFLFGGRVEGGFGPMPAVLGGTCFLDLDQNGERSADEPPAPGVPIVIQGPDDRHLEMETGPNGHYSVLVQAVGLYEVRVNFPPIMAPLEPFVTTANPLYVTMTPDPDGNPMSFETADFGVWDWPEPPPIEPVVFTDAPVDSLHQVQWNLIGAEVVMGHVLQLDVGYSGCSPPHEFTLFAHDGFMESLPPQLNLVLRHETDEACDAYLTETLQFDLWPVFRAYLQGYPAGELILNLVDFEGNVTQVPVFVHYIDGDLP